MPYVCDAKVAESEKRKPQRQRQRRLPRENRGGEKHTHRELRQRVRHRIVHRIVVVVTKGTVDRESAVEREISRERAQVVVERESRAVSSSRKAHTQHTDKCHSIAERDSCQHTDNKLEHTPKCIRSVFAVLSLSLLVA